MTTGICNGIEMKTKRAEGQIIQYNPHQGNQVVLEEASTRELVILSDDHGSSSDFDDPRAWVIDTLG